MVSCLSRGLLSCWELARAGAVSCQPSPPSLSLGARAGQTQPLGLTPRLAQGPARPSLLVPREAQSPQPPAFVRRAWTWVCSASDSAPSLLPQPSWHLGLLRCAYAFPGAS